MGDVGENGDFDGDAKSAELGEGVRSGFEDEKFGTRVCDGTDAFVKDFNTFSSHMFKLLVKRAGVETDVDDLVFVAIDTAPRDGGEEAGFVAGMVEHFPNHERSGSLAISTGDSDDAEMLGGEVISAGGVHSLEPVPR